MKKVDEVLLAGLGLTHLDMRDRNWRDAYDNEETPAEAVENLVGSMTLKKP